MGSISQGVHGKVFPLFKNITKKDKMKNFVALPREFVRTSWDMFTRFIISAPIYHIDDE